MLLGCQGPAINYIPAARTRPPNHCSERGTGMQTQGDNVPGLQPAPEGWGCEDTAHNSSAPSWEGWGAAGSSQLSVFIPGLRPAQSVQHQTCPAWPQPFGNISGEDMLRGLKTSLVKSLCHIQVSVPAALDSLGETWAFFSASLKQFPQFFGRQKAPSPHVKVFRTTIKLFYDFIIL